MPRDEWIRCGPARHAVRVRCWSPLASEDEPDTPVLLLHGLGVSSKYMVPFGRELAGTRSILAPDMPGHGRSYSPPHTLTIEDWVAVLIDMHGQLATGPWLVIANSFGSQVATELARARPDLVAGMVLIGPTTEPLRWLLPRHAMRLAADQLHEPASLIALQAFEYVRTGPVRTIREFLAGAKHDIAGRLAGVRAPVLFVRGEHDYISPAAWNQTLASHSRHGSCLEVPRVGHAAHYSAPTKLARSIEAWERCALTTEHAPRAR
jgi:pimeloyl-ACP methyl ester carboxylesterase